jgi:transposase
MTSISLRVMMISISRLTQADCYQIDIGITRLLWVGKERTIESFQGFFTAMGQAVISKIAFICSDMWDPYLKVIREKAQRPCISSTVSTS